MKRISKKEILYAIYIFLASRASVGGLAPFGIASFAVIFTANNFNFGYINILLYGVACILGAITTGVWEQILITAFGVLLYIIGCNLAKTNQNSKAPILLRSSIILIISSMIPMIILLSIVDATIMDILNLLIQAILTFVLFFIFRITETAISDILDSNCTSNKINNEEMICIAISIFIAFMGVPSLTVFGLSIRNVITMCIIMVFCLKGSIGTGSAAGIMIGILTNTASPIIVCVYGFCGFLGGLLNKFGKIGVISAFSIGNIILCFIFGAEKELIYSMFEAGFGAIIFCLLPKRLYDLIKIPFFENISINKNKIIKYDKLPVRYDYAGKIRDAVINKASFYSETLNEMSAELLEFSTENISTKNDNSGMLRVFNKVCSNCKLYGECWKKDYASREKTLLQCKKIINMNGDKRAEAFSILRDFCIRPNDVIEELRIGIEIERIEKICNSKLSEGREMFIKQFSEMSKISSKIADEIKYSTNYDMELERDIINTLRKREYYIFDAIVTKNSHNIPDVCIYTNKRYNKDDVNNIGMIISQLIGYEVDIYLIEEITTKKHIYKLNYKIKPKIKLKCGIKCMPANQNDISGDTYSYYEYDNYLGYMMISDGMGTGEGAKVQSNAVIKLLELFIKSGIDVHSAVSAIDMMISTGNSDVVTSTIDICKIDKNNMKAYFIKMGAVPSFIISQNEIKIVEINFPPVGVSSELKDLSWKVSECDIYPGDCIVMITDGIYDGFQNAGVNKKVMYEYIASLVRKINNIDFDCNKAANELCKKVSSISNSFDDMTVAILYVEES